MESEERLESDESVTVDRFKAAFKFYRSLENCQTSNKVFHSDQQAGDGHDRNSCFDRLIYTRSNSTLVPVSLDSTTTPTTRINNGHDCKPFFGLKSPHTWKIFRLNFPEGLIFIQNPFTVEGQRYWISKCALDYPSKPHITNIENLQIRKPQNTREKEGGKQRTPSCYQEESSSADFYKRLRWVTFGYHHDWDTKVYSEGFKCEFPSELAELTKYVSLVLGFQEFQAEAAIVNYYHLDSTLSGHQDRSERHQDAPLFSISFGQSAIFLIGDHKKQIEPIPICLKSGDIVIMSGRSRLSYHGVPRIFKNDSSSWLHVAPSSDETREETEEPANKKARRSNEFPEHSGTPSCPVCYCEDQSRIMEGSKKVLDQWDDFLVEYISGCRINLNVRQVLLPGELKLPSSDN